MTAAYAWPAGCNGPNTLKNRKASASKPQTDAQASAYDSVASFDAA